jgi:hypothetical protein
MTIFILWLVTGIGFATAVASVRRAGKPMREAWTSYEGIFFVASIVVPLLLLILRAAR